MKNKKLTHKKLKKILHYDPETGIFRWLVANAHRVKVGDVAGCVCKTSGYRIIIIYSKRYNASRLAFFYMEGYWPEYEVDHRDRIKHNDAWSNLRHVSRVCNMRNQKISCKNKSGVTGVCWNKGHNKWHAQIKVLQKQKSLGYFTNLKDAVKARWEAEKEYGWPSCNTTSSAFEFLQKRELI